MNPPATAEIAFPDTSIRIRQETEPNELDIARAEYVRAANQAQLYGGLPGQKQRLISAEDTYQYAWEQQLKERLNNTELRGEALIFDMNSAVTAENQRRAFAEQEDLDNRRYSRFMLRYQQLNRSQKLGIGVALGGVTAASALVTGGATLAVVGMGAATRFGTTYINRESARIHSHAGRDRSAGRFIESNFAHQAEPTELQSWLGSVVAKNIMADNVEAGIRSARLSVAYAAAGIVIGRALATADILGQHASSPKVEAFKAKLLSVPKKALGIKQLLDTTPLLPVEQASHNSSSPQRTWHTVKGASRSLWVRENAQGDYRFFANQRFNSVWDLSKQALRLNGDKKPNLQHITDLKNAIVQQRLENGKSASLDTGERVSISRRLLNRVLAKNA